MALVCEHVCCEVPSSTEERVAEKSSEEEVVDLSNESEQCQGECVCLLLFLL